MHMQNENTIRSNEIRLGYSKEEDYFNRVNRKLAREQSHPICSACGSSTVDLIRNRVVTQQCPHCLSEFSGGVRKRNA